MEKIKVNMSPNPLDVQTIHASQNDTEAREWEFELHNNGELIDTSEITEQLFFKSYKGGTEQLLPENGSTPTTSPFIGDIRYPQGLLTDQEFTYRQSPTEEDGLAKITDIKGNTLVWNQQLLAPTTNASATASADGSFRSNRCTFTYDSATHIITITSLENMGTSGFVFGLANGAPLVNGHKYLQMCDVQAPKTFNFTIGRSGGTDVKTGLSANTYHHVSTIKEFVSGTNEFLFNFNSDNSWSGSETVYIKNAMLIDLTQMGLDITDPSDFTSLFPLSYYSYNQGSLLSFNSNGIKTVGKNLNPWTGVDYVASTSRTVFLKKGDYVLSTDNGNNFEGSTQIYLCLADSNGNNITSGGITSGYLSLNGSGTFYYGGYGRNNIPFTLNLDAFVSFGFNNQKPTNINEIQLEFGSTPSDYEPYTSSTLSLPISTYFPSGMKSAGNVYDELTPTKAISRIGSVDLGSFTWTVNSTYGNIFQANLADCKQGIANQKANILCAKYETEVSGSNAVISTQPDKTIRVRANTTVICILDSTYSTAEALATALDGVYLYYELATPTETSFTTASLVTENAEIPLSNNDGVLIGKCTEQLSENPGFIDAKIKLSDADGECYSNKIQLHVERSPQ